MKLKGQTRTKIKSKTVKEYKNKKKSIALEIKDRINIDNKMQPFVLALHLIVEQENLYVVWYFLKVIPLSICYKKETTITSCPLLLMIVVF